ncbi:putative solute carrier family 46 member 3-like [Penaeus vannamei]|uniref:Putative solute carrier family 46 member 3-like n=1 Tax=Penaeus vannamei TaxID=6689 RepID=A0A3R7P1W3_PENVA|nr:putative solute carrier family 46 member 3-like [Penaeus vannamei]
MREASQPHECQNITALGTPEEGAIQREATWLLMVQELVATSPRPLRPRAGFLERQTNIALQTNACCGGSGGTRGPCWHPPGSEWRPHHPLDGHSYVSDLSGLQSRTLSASPSWTSRCSSARPSASSSAASSSPASDTWACSASAARGSSSASCTSSFASRTPLAPRGKCDMVRDLFDLTNVRATLIVATKRRKDHGRAKIFALMFAMCLLLFVIVSVDSSCLSETLGGAHLEYLFVKKKFNWTYEQFVNLSIFDIVFGSVGTSMLLPILSYKFGMEDSILGLLGVASKISGLVLMALSPSSWYMYVASVVSFLAGLPLIVTRSVISKLVPEDEVGAVFSLLASWEALVPLFSGPVYTFVYAHTIDVFPGVIYFVSSERRPSLL